MSRIQQNIYKTSSISSSFLRDDSIHRTDTKLSKTPEKNAAKETVVKIHAMYSRMGMVCISQCSKYEENST